MRQIILLIIFFLITFFTFSQNRKLHFKDGFLKSKGDCLYPERNVKETQNYIEVNYDFEDASVLNINKDTNQFQLIKIKGFSNIGDEGKPSLPCYNDILIVPQKKGLVVKIVDSTYQEYSSFNIPPAEEPKTELEKNVQSQLKFDALTYLSNSYYPNSLVEIIDVQIYRGIPLAFTQIRPIQYNPKTKKIRCYSNIKYQICFTEEFSEKKVNVNNETVKILENTVSNSDIIEKEYSVNTLKSTSIATSTSVNYIIITTDEFLHAANEFADWKTMLGFKCEVISQASWTSDQVKTMIHSRYEALSPKPEYFLIIGDHDDVPGQELQYVSGAYSETYATDLFYVCMDGSRDYMPDMARGRVSVSSLEEAYFVLRKIINYERNPVEDVSFYQNASHCAYFEDGDYYNLPDSYADEYFLYTSEEVRNYMLNKGKIVDRIYYAEDDVIPRFYRNNEAIPAELRKDISPYYPWDGNNADITDAINEGQFYIFHRDHGYSNGSGWVHPSYTTSDIPNLNNGDKLPIIFSIECSAGGFQHDKCFAEMLLRHSTGGAVGVIAATSATYSGANDALAVGLFDAIWSNPGLIPSFNSSITTPTTTHSDIYRMGNVLNQGLFRMFQTYGHNNDSTTFVRFHYFGDPSMEINTESPSTFANVIAVQSGSSVTVNAGVANCKITISGILDRGESYFKSVNNVSSYTFSNVVEPYCITVTKHNYKPYICVPAVYIQNYTFTTDKYLIGNDFFIGSNVTTTQTQGNVVIEGGNNLTIDADGMVIIKNSFEYEVGGTLEIK